MQNAKNPSCWCSGSWSQLHERRQVQNVDLLQILQISREPNAGRLTTIPGLISWSYFLSYEQGRFMPFWCRKEVPFQNSTQLLEQHKNYFSTSISEDLFLSCFMLLPKPLEWSSRKLTEDGWSIHSMKMGYAELNVPLVLFSVELVARRYKLCCKIMFAPC